MKLFGALFSIILILFCDKVGYSQKITTGIYSGVNFSDIHGQDSYGKWVHKAGPVQGIYLKYSFNRYLGVQTGLSYSTIYYEYDYYSRGFIEYSSFRNNYLPGFYPDYYPSTILMDFSFLRVPILFSVSIPSAVNFDLKAGLFYSFLGNHGSNSDYYYPEPEKRDFGYLASSVISYPLNDNLKASFSISYLKGQKTIFNDSNLKHGSSEFTLGLAYNGFLKKRNTAVISTPSSDTVNRKITLGFYGGFNLSWNRSQTEKESYSTNFGPSIGFLLDYRFDRIASLQTGLSFERKGYSFRDSSASFYLYNPNANPLYNTDTKTNIDYMVIPLLLKFQMGKHIWFNTGPWIGLLLNSRCTGVAYNELRTQNNYYQAKTVVYDDLENVIKDNDTGWIFGGGVTLPLKNNYSVNLAIRYSTGFRNVFDPSAAGYQQYGSSDMSIHNRTISFLIGLKIPQADHFK